jgi:hypothetical protein
MADPERGVDLTVNSYGADLGLDRAQQARQNELQIPLLESTDTDANGLFWISTALIREEIYPVFEAGGITDLPDPDDFVDTTVLQEALA